MRFFDRHWIEGEMDAHLRAMRVGVYIYHLEDIEAELPHGVRVLAHLDPGTSLFGARIAAARPEPGTAGFLLVLHVEARNAEGGRIEYFLELEYTGVNEAASDTAAFEDATRCLTNEFDLGPDGAFIHRILLEPEGEAVICARDIRFSAREVNPPGADFAPEREE
jgi:hypothetical protein